MTPAGFAVQMIGLGVAIGFGLWGLHEQGCA